MEIAIKDTEYSVSVAIRADGDRKIGTGHLMRCLTIAHALKKQGANIIFYVSSQEAADFLQSRGWSSTVVIGIEDMEAELSILLPMLEAAGHDFLLVDSYHVTASYLETLGKVLPVCYLDDLGEQVYPVSAVINYNFYAHRLSYETKYPRDTTLLLGAAYAPVRNEFSKVKYQLRESGQQILITMGGSDELNIAYLVADYFCTRERFSQDPAPILHIVCGGLNPHLNQLKCLSELHPNLVIHHNVENMATLMAQCDMAISAAGSTIYELCTVGLPTVICYYADNQRLIATSCSRATGCYMAGDFRQNPDKKLEDIYTSSIDMLELPIMRQKISDNMRKLVDGRGADRLSKSLCKLYGSK
jgi:UDP-2,4-diacetamido-2,4,6-trideoxy-beta-L-altropyranose hydrolase